jgi:hypothetical protein
MASVRGFLRYVREHADEALREKVAPARIPPASMGLALRSQTEALAVVMLCPDEDIRREAAAEGRAMLTGVDWSRVGDARVWECLDLAYWRGVEAGVLPA